MDTNSPRMIFHHPQPFMRQAVSGTGVRPRKMLESFRSLGYEVDVVAGNAVERSRAMKDVIKKMDDGVKYTLCYSESSTLPMMLADKKGLFTHFDLDFRFFSRLRSRGIPVGYFLRDIYWRFPLEWGGLSPIKKKIATLFYSYDTLRFNGALDVLFVPSNGFLRHLPSLAVTVRELPPGCDIVGDSLPEHIAIDRTLQLLYVGGIKPPFYDISEALETIREMPFVRFTVVCREGEWAEMCSHYFPDGRIPEHITIKHIHGEELTQEYLRSDAMVLFRKPSEYLKITWPIKVFESLGYGVPIIASPESLAAELVEKEDLGWVVPSPQAFSILLHDLHVHRDQLMKKRARVMDIRRLHTWQQRALAVVSACDEIRGRVALYC